MLHNKKTVSRIDFETDLVDKNAPKFEIYTDGSETPNPKASWMTRHNLQGYVIEKAGEEVDVIVKTSDKVKIKISLRGPWEKDADDKMVEHWVKYTSMTVDGEEILSEPVDTWHNKPFIYYIDNKANEEHKLHIKWTKVDK